MNQLITPEVIQEEAEKHGVTTSRATQLSNLFLPMLNNLKENEEAYNTIITDATSEIDKDLCERAKKLRITISKIRTGTDKARAAEKKSINQAGKAIDGAANIIKWATQDQEEKLRDIEMHHERKEAARVREMDAIRCEELDALDYNHEGKDLGNMDDDVWHALFTMAKGKYEDVKEAERQAEERRVEKEKADAIERKRVQKENEELREQKIIDDKKRDEERAEAKKIQDKKDAAAKKIQDKKDAEVKKEREVAAAKQKKLQDQVDKQKAKEKKAADAEKARLKKIADDKKALDKASDAVKLKAFAVQLEGLDVPSTLDTELNEEIVLHMRAIWKICMEAQK